MHAYTTYDIQMHTHTHVRTHMHTHHFFLPGFSIKSNSCVKTTPATTSILRADHVRVAPPHEEPVRETLHRGVPRQEEDVGVETPT